MVRVPRPCVFCKGGWRCCRPKGFHSSRTTPLRLRSWFPPFAKCAKDGAPTVLPLPARSQARGARPRLGMRCPQRLKPGSFISAFLAPFDFAQGRLNIISRALPGFFCGLRSFVRGGADSSCLALLARRNDKGAGSFAAGLKPRQWTCYKIRTRARIVPRGGLAGV